MSYPAVYALLRERMADEHDIPTDDEIIAAALDVARDAVAALRSAIYNTKDGPAIWREDALAAIDALQVEA